VVTVADGDVGADFLLRGMLSPDYCCWGWWRLACLPPQFSPVAMLPLLHHALTNLVVTERIVWAPRGGVGE
jgi:hypothetical protein